MADKRPRGFCMEFKKSFFRIVANGLVGMAFVVGSALPLMAKAADNLGLDTTAVGAGFNIGVGAPEVIVGKIIFTVLSFLGLIGFCLVLYAGFLWMTAGGEEDQISQAKDILKAAVIGLAIILFSYGVTTLVINTLVGQTLKS